MVRIQLQRNPGFRKHGMTPSPYGIQFKYNSQPSTISRKLNWFVKPLVVTKGIWIYGFSSEYRAFPVPDSQRFKGQRRWLWIQQILVLSLRCKLAFIIKSVLTGWFGWWRVGRVRDGLLSTMKKYLCPTWRCPKKVGGSSTWIACWTHGSNLHDFQADDPVKLDALSFIRCYSDISHCSIFLESTLEVGKVIRKVNRYSRTIY